MKLQKVKILLISTIVFLAAIFPASSVYAATTTKRLGGDTRFETAIEISKEFDEVTNRSIDSVIVCTAYGYADSVSVTPFAIFANAPILLTNKDALPSSTKTRISEMNVKKAYVIGGTGVISDKVLSDLKAMGLTVERIGGNNRFETNRLILAKIPENQWGNSPKFVNAYDVYTGLTVTVDTVEQTNPSKINPIILIDKNDGAYNMESEYVIDVLGILFETYGSTLVPYVSDIAYFSDVKNLSNLTTTDLRLESGQSAATTNKLFADKFKIHPYTKYSVLITTGNNYVDAISAGPLAAATYSPILFISSDQNKNSDKNIYTGVQKVYYVGGVNVVPDGAENSF